MLFKERVWSVTDVKSAKDLARKLTRHTWPLCTGFRLKWYLFLNDSTSENGAQEYAILKDDTLQQIESITFSWCSEKEALTYVQNILEGRYDSSERDSGITRKQLQTPKEHGVCSYCM